MNNSQAENKALMHYPFGMLMPGRNFSSETYRFGFQNQEKDDEIKGDGNSVNYTFRVHDTRLGRFLSVDPLEKDYPQWAPYVFSGNQVTYTVELEGLEPADDKNINPSSSISSMSIVQQMAMELGLPNGNSTILKNDQIEQPHEKEQIEIEASSNSPSIQDGDRLQKIKSYPEHTDSYEGFWGKVNYVWSGGNESGARYDWDGNYLGPSPIMGMPPSFIGGPLRKGQSAIKIGKYLFNPNYLHTVVKPQVLKGAGDFIGVVGHNPDIGIKGTQIILNGAKNGPYIGKTFETGLSILDFIF